MNKVIRESKGFKVRGLLFKKIAPDLINSYEQFGKNKIIKENGYELRINKGSTILRIPKFDRRVKSLTTDYYIDNSEQLIHLITVSDLANKGSIQNLLGVLNSCEVSISGGLNVSLIVIPEGRFWKVGSNKLSIEDFHTITNIEEYLLGYPSENDTRFGSISESQFQRLKNNFDIFEVSFNERDDTSWDYDELHSCLTYSVVNWSGDSIYCEFHVKSFEMAYKVFETIHNNEEIKLLNELKIVSKGSDLISSNLKGPNGYQVNLSSHPERRGLIKVNKNKSIEVSKDTYLNTVSSDLEASDFYPLIQNYQNFILAISPLCIRNINGQIYISDTYNVFDEKLVLPENIIFEIETHLQKISSLPDDWSITIDEDYLFNRKLEIVGYSDNNTIIRPEDLYPVIRKQANFSFTSSLTVNKFNNSFYLCDPYESVPDKEIFIGDIEKEMKDLMQLIDEII